jgi:hypothetical protein
MLDSSIWQKEKEVPFVHTIEAVRKPQAELIFGFIEMSLSYSLQILSASFSSSFCNFFLQHFSSSYRKT